MYDPNLEALIEIALKEGGISEKSKSILIKKAQSLGIDIDEFEMVLEHRVKTASKNASSGELSKCPACGSFSSGLSAICKDCGYEFKNTKASESITAFFKKLDEIEEKRNENPFESKKLSANIGCGTAIMWMCLYPFLIPYNIIVFLINKAKPPRWSNIDLRKEEMVISFPIPSNKEDLIQFSELCLSKIKRISFLVYFEEEGKYLSKWNDIWKTKAIQIYKKAETALVEDQGTIEKLKAELIKKGIIESEKSSSYENDSPVFSSDIKYEIVIPFASYVVIAALWFISSLADRNGSLGSFLFLGILAALGGIAVFQKNSIPEKTKMNIVFIASLILCFLAILSFFEGLAGTKTVLLLGSALASAYFAYQGKAAHN